MQQKRRSLAIVLAMAALVMAYHVSMQVYLQDLDKPLLLEIGFFSSLALACSYELKNADRKYAAMGCLATGLVFVFGTWMAIWLRIEYLQMISQIKDNAEIAAYVGRDLHEALSARYVGYGGCFALGLLLTRLVLDRLARKGFVAIFIPPMDRPAPCPCCGQLVVGRPPASV